MSKALSDTAAIAAKPVLEISNPDYSGFRNRDTKCLGQQRNPDAGMERPTAALTKRLDQC